MSFPLSLEPCPSPFTHWNAALKSPVLILMQRKKKTQKGRNLGGKLKNENLVKVELKGGDWGSSFLAPSKSHFLIGDSQETNQTDCELPHLLIPIHALLP